MTVGRERNEKDKKKKQNQGKTDVVYGYCR